MEDLIKEINALEGGRGFTVCGLYGSSKSYLLARFVERTRRHILVVTPDESTSEDLAGELGMFLRREDIVHFPSTELLPFETQQVHPDILAGRMEFLFTLLNSNSLIGVTPVVNLLQRVIPKEVLINRTIYIKKGRECDLVRFMGLLSEMGYVRRSMVEERGEMSIRGGIVDLFPPSGREPVRIEFFGDEIESIRYFDPSTQRSIKEVEELRILPAGEVVADWKERHSVKERLVERAMELGLEREAWEGLAERLREGVDVSGMGSILPLFYERLDTLFDYLRNDTVIFLVEPSSVRSGMDDLFEVIHNEEERALKDRRFFVRPDTLYLKRDELHSLMDRLPVVGLEGMKGTGVEIDTESNMDIRQDINLRRGDTPLRPLADRIQGWLEEGRCVYITSHNRGQADRTRELIGGYGLKPEFTDGYEILKRRGPFLGIVVGTLSTGFRIPSEGIVVITEEEIFGERVRRRIPPPKGVRDFLTELQDLSTGDYVVHKQHGIGLYRGLKRLCIDGVDCEFMLIEYRGGDRLYLPVSRMDLVSKYRGPEGRSPELDRLGGSGWERTKKRVKKAVGRIAGELLKLYAERAVARGFAFSPPDRLFREFEAGFEYDETPDQARAIDECIRDMTDEKPMDRLVCGDVGYGKTEVAMRASFKAVLDSKQVAVVVPTTVLAQQHYMTFKKRFAPYPVIVEVLSRFKTRREQKDILNRLARGEIDILIGTHRLLQKDVSFRDLGLIIIDEEHRFGVKDKERLKTLKKQVDVLTLTATPIPRTLRMALTDIRDLSIISTPPENRLSIKTSVIRFEDGVIAEAIERELKRGGQVFFVHNRVQSIGSVERFLRRIVPHARIAVAHGQMKESELEKRMLGFVERRYDILLCTTIIESGLDIPTANTIIINRADRFGLAELYQLRGRVGRGGHRAYAYFICPPMNELTEEARKRLEVIQNLTEPGSGFRIATYDLEIRGAGELLGSQQSGHITEVGFDMYLQLLDEAVKELRGEEIRDEPEPEINLKVSQYIPEEYIPDTKQRLNFYKRLASVKSSEDIDSIRDELIDRYGRIPGSVNNLILTSELRLMLKKTMARELIQKGTRLYITFDKDGTSMNGLGERLVSLVNKDPVRFRLSPDMKLIYIMKPDLSPIDGARYVLQGLSGE